MKTLIVIIFLAILSTGAFSRDNFNIGLFAGTSYYMGDINSSWHFYKPSPAFGMLVKYDFNDHYALKAGVNYGQISADDLDFAGIIHQTRGAVFVNNFYDFSLQGEFNFQPFRSTIFKKPVTTFITAGLAYTNYPGISEAPARNMNIPFGGGVKYGMSSKVTIGFEWIMKKTFTDTLDGVKSFGQFNTPSLVHNNDWVSLAGFFITIKPFERKGDCPAYWN
jgi:hypothetical protein